MPKYFYHATLDENIAGIHKRGLQPVKDTGQCHWGGEFANQCLGRAYLSSDLEMSLFYGGIIQRLRAEQDCQEEEDAPSCVPEIILLRVSADKVKDAHPDPGTASDYYVERAIPATHIEYLRGDYCWQPLAKANPGTIEAIDGGEWREAPVGDIPLRQELENRKQAMARLAKTCSRRRRGQG